MRLRGLSELTITRRRQILATVASSAGVPLLRVTESQLMTWREGLALGAGTTCTNISHVASFYAWAAERGLRRDNPAARLPRPKLGRRLPRPIGEDDLTAALDGARQPLRLWLVLMGWCGLRCKEVALLRRDCIRENDPAQVIHRGRGRDERPQRTGCAPVPVRRQRDQGRGPALVGVGVHPPGWQARAEPAVAGKPARR
jgi:site-specific recombinase XerD